jgi:pyruvate-ferredoxin/flavodoxin oxidoreductase
LSSALRDVSVLRKRMPTFDALLCTGCGKCWASCPDSSLAPTVLSIQKLLESGISIAKTRGTNAEALALIIPKLAVRINSQLVKSENPPTTLEPLCGEIFDDMLPKLPFPDERKQEIDAAFRAVMTHLGTFPVSRTQPFFDAPEQKSSGTGEIFSLVLNPDTCKGCLICVEVCEPKALTSGKQTAERIEHTRELWRLWERLPDVSGKVIERASYNPDVGVLPAILLSRHCLLSMIGGDSGEPGSGMKIALRLLIASTEFHIQRKLQRYLEEIDSLRISITERIRELLVAALPTDDLSKLEESIDILNRGRASLSELTAKLETTQQIDQISLTPLQRLVTMAQELGDFHWKISQGTHGMGRARLGLLISPNAYSHGVYLFPYNSFQAPVVIDDSGEPTSFARGILEGHLREILEGIQLIRQARLELTSPRQAALTESSIMSLSWDDLDEEERSLCPPLLLVGSSDTFNDRALVRLLESDLPIKVLLGTDSSFDLEQDYKHVGHPKMGFWHLRYRRAFVLQSSIACYNHLADGFARSLKYNGPALLHIFTPSPIRGNFPAERTIHQAKIVVDSRAFPLFTFDPSLHGEFGSRLSLAGNPAPSELWASVSEGKAILPTDWLLTEGRFSTQFMPLKTDDPNPRELLKYLELPIAEQEHSTAYIEIHGDSPQRLRLSHALISMMRELIARWRILQELAGVISPFTEIIRAQIERDLVIVHDQAMLDLRREYEQRIAQLKQQHSAEIAQQLQMRLMSLAGYRVQ